MRRYQCLWPVVSVVLGGLLAVLPVEAAELESWRFDAQQNRLLFTTDEAVQPRAQFLVDPPRIVIDLPGTSLGRPTVNQPIGGSIREVRIGQVDSQTTRLVIELSPGYTMDPAQIVVRGETPLDWVVELPPAQLESAVANLIEAPSATNAVTHVERILVTPDGFFIGTTGASPNLTVQPVEDGQVVLLIENATVDAALAQQVLPSGAFGVTAWEIDQVPGEVPVLQITLTIPDGSTDWQAFVSGGSGIVVLPPREIAIAARPVAAESISPTVTARPPVAEPPPIVPQPVPEPPRQSIPEPSVPSTNLRLENITIVIDPGHGGRDPGAIGIGGLREKDVVSDIAYEVAEILEQLGAHVILTRSDDREIDLDPRVQIAERANADLFVSIHANAISLERPDVNGLETYYYSSSGFQLAETIHDAILQDLDMRDRGVRQARFYVLRNTSMPAVLVETGFVTGAQDAQYFNDPTWRSQMARAITDGILNYVEHNLVMF